MLNRREYLKLSAFASVGAALPAHAEAAADFTLTIAPHSFEYRPNHFLKTIAYNDQVPGPLLRMTEGKPVTIDVINNTPVQELVHWHSLFLPSNIDGAMEEGTPMIPANGKARYQFTPSPVGFRWYHTHTPAAADMKKGQYTGQHGPLLIDPSGAGNNPARYDKEFFLTLHDWSGQFLPSGDGSLMPTYDVSTINGRTLGFGEPLRVAPGDRALLHILNSSPTEVHWLALPGHQFQVLALDGNSVPTSRAVSQLRLSPAERITALVKMSNPGIWILGEIRKHLQAAGMGIVIEYANTSGKPQWQQPQTLTWNYSAFAAPSTAPPDSTIIDIPLLFTSKFRGHGAEEQWLINDESYPQTSPIVLRQGLRYRLRMENRGADDHPIHLHRHVFELRRISGIATSGILKDTVLLPAGEQAEVEFTANNRGDTLLHCHQQDHMDNGFMMLFRYA